MPDENQQPSITTIDSETLVKTKDTQKALLSRVGHFTVRHWRALTIIILVILAATMVFFTIPVISINNSKVVNLDAKVTLKAGDRAILKGQNVSASIKHFTNEVCPKKGTCFGSDVTAVEYELTVNGTHYATGSQVSAAGSAYQIETIMSDYKTYATVKIIKK